MYFEIFTLTIAILLVFHIYTNNKNDYWSKKNIKFLKPLPFFGVQLYKIIKLPTATELATSIYNKFPNEKLIGYFIGSTPALLVKDPELLKHVCVSDFDHFHERVFDLDEEASIYLNVFHSSGERWKLLRQKLTPAFSKQKLLKMYPLILNCAQKLQTLGDRIVKNGAIVDAYDMMSRYTMECICNCGIGIDLDIIMDEQSEFYQFTKNVFSLTYWQYLVNVVGEVLPLPKWLSQSQLIHSKTFRIVNDMTLKICKQRSYKPIGRHDFIDLLLELAAAGKLKGEWKKPNGSLIEEEIDLSSPEVFAAQVYIFFAAGFDTSATSASYTLHQLAYQQNIQRDIQSQIDEVLLKYDSKMCYDAVSEMTLLKMSFLESLRMFPPVGVNGRKCTKKYTFPGTNVTIDPGVRVIIPAAAIQTDSKYYPNPKEFKPERFKPEAVKERDKYTYMPFGLGKRMCIGSRLAQMQSLAGLAALLQRFSVEPAPRSRRDIKESRGYQLIQKPDGGLPIKLVPRKL